MSQIALSPLGQALLARRLTLSEVARHWGVRPCSVSRYVAGYPDGRSLPGDWERRIGQVLSALGREPLTENEVSDISAMQASFPVSQYRVR